MLSNCPYAVSYLAASLVEGHFYNFLSYSFDRKSLVHVSHCVVSKLNNV